MENIGRLFDQVAREAGVSTNKAKVAVYLIGLAKDGRSVGDCATALRRKPDLIKRFAREFMIDFPDYRPFARMEAKGVARPEPRYLLATSQ